MQTQIYDATYYALSLVALVLLSTTALRSARLARSATDRAQRSGGAIAGAAIGVLAALVTGVGLNAIRGMTGDVVYQEVHFPVLYAGFGLVLWAADRLALAQKQPRALQRFGFGPTGRRASWVLFGLAVAVATIKLFGDGVQPAILHSPMPQQPVYYTPVFVGLALAIGAVASSAARGSGREIAWFAAFCLLLGAGFLREATIIPSTNEPFVDLALAFGPFTAAAVCLYGGGRAIARSTTITARALVSPTID